MLKGFMLLLGFAIGESFCSAGSGLGLHGNILAAPELGETDDPFNLFKDHPYFSADPRSAHVIISKMPRVEVGNVISRDPPPQVSDLDFLPLCCGCCRVRNSDEGAPLCCLKAGSGGIKCYCCNCVISRK
jgi:hypothetical protein